MREADFTTELIRTFRRDGSWVYKIPDAPTSKITGMRFTATKPFDLVVCIGGKFVAIECKQIKKWRAFSLRDMRDSQLVNLPAVLRADGRAFVFLNVRIPRKENRLIILEWEYWGPRLEKESIKAEELKRMASTLPCKPVTENGKTFFELTDFYAYLNLF